MKRDYKKPGQKPGRGCFFCPQNRFFDCCAPAPAVPLQPEKRYPCADPARSAVLACVFPAAVLCSRMDPPPHRCAPDRAKFGLDAAGDLLFCAALCVLPLRGWRLHAAHKNAFLYDKAKLALELFPRIPGPLRRSVSPCERVSPGRYLSRPKTKKQRPRLSRSAAP